MIGLIFALVKFCSILIFAILRITGLWVTALSIGISIIVHFYIVPIPDSIAAFIIYASLILSGICLVRNIFRICNNIYRLICRKI